MKNSISSSVLRNSSRYISLGYFLIFLFSCSKEPATPVEKIVGYQGVHINSDAIVNGYTNKISYAPNEMVSAYLNSKDTVKNAVVKLFSVNGLSVDSTMVKIFPQKIKNSNAWENGYGYDATFSYSPQKLKSGIYLWEKKIPIIIKASEPKDITILYPSNRENAYCLSGGFSMYSTPQPARVVSFMRPILFTFFAAKFLEWVNQTEFSEKINYIADSDLEDYSVLSNTKLLILTGHSEYWTRQARINFDRFVDEGKNVLILSGNTMWWQVRYNNENNQLICYRESALDPISDPLFKTINWYEPTLKYPIINSIGGDFIHGGYGDTADEGWDGYKISNPNSPLLEGTNLKKGEIISIPTHEYDGTQIKSYDSEGYPVIESAYLKYLKSEIIGFDFGFRVKKTCGTFMVFKKSLTSGIIINTGTTDWCSEKGIGGKDGEKIKIITKNMISKLLNNLNVFSQ